MTLSQGLIILAVILFIVDAFSQKMAFTRKANVKFDSLGWACLIAGVYLGGKVLLG